MTSALVALLVAAPLLARADVATAQALFDQGKQLVKEGKVTEGCTKLAQSQRLDPSPGTLASLADCEEKLGQLATAWATFLSASTLAEAQGRREIVDAAEARARALEARLSRLVVTVAAPVPGLVVFRNQTKFDEATLGTGLPVDPGEYEIRAEAPGYRAWSTRVAVKEEGTTLEVTIPALEKAPVAEAPAGQAEPPPAAKEPAPRVVVPPRSPPEGSPTLAYVIGASGLAFAGVGAAFGVMALGNDAEVERLCPRHTNCPDGAVSAAESRDRNAWVANIGVGLGLVGVATSSVLLLTRGSARAGGERAAQGRGVGFDFGVSQTGGSALVTGAF